MKQGWLIVNGYITNPKFLEIYRWIEEAGARKGCQIRRFGNNEMMEAVCSGKIREMERPDFVIFWDKDVRLARLMEEEGFRLFNSAQSIAVCDDKSRTYICLKNAEISMPKTWIAPMTFAKDGYYDQTAYFEHAGEDLGYPLVLKESFGSFGAQVHLVQSEQELKTLLPELKNRPFLLQEYIKASKGHDIRINMVGENPVAAMYRYNDADFRANITNGGSMKPYEPKEAQVELARKVMRTLGLDFAGVDILFGEEEEPILCEVNSNAHFKNIYDCTGINVVDAIISYILEQL